MKLIQGLSIIAFSCATSAVAIYFIRRKKLSFKHSFRETLEENSDASTDYELGLHYKTEAELSDLNWVKIGTVQQLQLFPLNSGEEKICSTLKVSSRGLINTEDQGFVLWDRMFQIYDKKTEEFQTEMTDISMISVNVVNKSKVRISAWGMSDLSLEVNNESDKIFTEMKTSLITLKYFDCGDVAAEWMNIFFRSSTLRLLRGDYEITDELGINSESLVNEQVDLDIWCQLLTLTRYVVVTGESMRKLKTESPFKIFPIRPNIIIEAPSCSAFEEENWKWIKIGNIFMKRIKSVPSSSFSDDMERNEMYMGVDFEFFNSGDINMMDNVYIN